MVAGAAQQVVQVPTVRLEVADDGGGTCKIGKYNTTATARRDAQLHPVVTLSDPLHLIEAVPLTRRDPVYDPMHQIPRGPGRPGITLAGAVPSALMKAQLVAAQQGSGDNTGAGRSLA